MLTRKQTYDEYGEPIFIEEDESAIEPIPSKTSALDKLESILKSLPSRKEVQDLVPKGYIDRTAAERQRRWREKHGNPKRTDYMREYMKRYRERNRK